MRAFTPLLWFDPEHHTGVCAPAERGGPVEFAARTKDHARGGLIPIRPAGEAVEHRLIAGRIDFIHRSRARCAATGRGPVEVAR